MKADIDLDIGRKTFASGLLPELIAMLRRSREGDVVAVVGDEESIGPELETWCRFTGNTLLETTVEICVEPKPRAHGPSLFGSHASGSASENPPLTAVFDCRLQ